MHSILIGTVLTTLAIVTGAKKSGNMNGKYILASGSRGPGVTYNDDFSSKNYKYFDVWAPEIATHYGQVFWTDQHNQPLPTDIVSKFNNKVIAIVGYEQDQVMVNPVGKPGLNPDQDVSVPINWAYNHHYMCWMTGNFSTLRKVKTTPNEKAAHATATKWIPTDTTMPNETPYPNVPTSHFFSEGNGGESRKSYHGYPKGYAQLLQSPQTWHLTPMQIDTRNRDCGANPSDIDNCTTDPKTGYPGFTPGPEPLQARYGLGIPAKGTNYSGVLECPCNSRYGGAKSIYGKNSSETKQTIHHFQTQTTPCGPHQTFKDAASCFAGILAINVNNTVTNTTVNDPKTYPSGCSVSYDAKTGETAAIFNTATSSTTTCAIGTKHTGQAKSLIGVQVRVEIDATQGPVVFKSGGKGKYCTNNRQNVIGTYTMTAATVAAASVAAKQCQAACTSNKQCQACSVDCPYELEVGDEFSNEKCLWSALPSCGPLKSWQGWIEADVLLKTKGQVTITASGPSKAWFGVGFNAHQMVDQPYTLIVNSTGVIEQKIGTCGSEAQHCPGTHLNTTITLVSNTVLNGRRTVVVTRSTSGATQDYYSFNPTEQSTIPLITAIGNTQVFAYHKAHMPTTLALVDVDGDTCVCDTGSIGQMCDSTGGECQQFVKNCVKSPAGSLLQQKNPTCNTETYAGGLQCCHHGRIMLDTNQEIRPELLRYHMKFRFWYQEYDLNVNGTGIASHLNLPRVYQQTEADAGEYDIPPAFAQKEHPIPGYPNYPLDTPTPGTVCTGDCGSGDNMKENCECVHSIFYKWTVGTEQSPIATKKGETMSLIYAGGHCHAPSCLSITLYRNDTGEIICSQLPIYGNGDVKNDKYDEAGYVALPPCLWGSESGLDNPIALPFGTPLLSIKRNRNTHVGHFGEMASWQMRGVMNGE